MDNVKNFDGYISCDDQTISEIVVPVFSKNKLIGVLDIDGHLERQFDHTDKKYLEKIVDYLVAENYAGNKEDADAIIGGMSEEWYYMILND